MCIEPSANDPEMVDLAKSLKGKTIESAVVIDENSSTTILKVKLTDGRTIIIGASGSDEATFCFGED